MNTIINKRSGYVSMLLALLILPIWLYGQQVKTEFSRRPEPDPTIANLRVGDRVPDILIAKIIRDKQSTAKISDFKDQLLLLDFWDTFCGACIEALPKLDSLQRSFGDRIKVLPASYQSEAVITNFFAKNHVGQQVQLPCVVEDKVLGSHFRHKLISHVVWIQKGVVVAITGTDYVTAHNIETILSGERVSWPVKNDLFTFDARQSLFALTDISQYITAGALQQHSGISGHISGIDVKGGLTLDTIGHLYRTYIYNKSIVDAFGMITFKLNPRTFIPHPGRQILEVKDRNRYVRTAGQGTASDWHRANDICYELVTSRAMSEQERVQYVYEDLQRILGVHARWEKRLVNCLVLIKNRDVDIEAINAARKGMQTVVSAVPVFFLDQTEKFPPALDETGIGDKFIKIEGVGSDTVEGLRRQLQLYGCDLIEAEREIDVLVITENGYKKT